MCVWAVVDDVDNVGLDSARPPVHGRSQSRACRSARSAAMAMVGHKTESIYRRYSIVDETMLDIGRAKLNELHTQMSAAPHS
jgi:hypothetical protein